MNKLDKDIRVRLMIFVIGFAPITSLALSAFTLIPLHISGPYIVLPSILGAFALAAMHPEYSQIMVRGFTLGLAAVLLYDMTCRFPFIAAGMWPDFIPKIGSYLLNRENVPSWVGYLWRYGGNGGGMGLAFYAIYPLFSKQVRPLKAGVIYGVIIFCCLLGTIYLSPSGRTYLFAPTLFTGVLGLLGHLVYGFTLGYGTRRFPSQPVQVINMHEQHEQVEERAA